MTVRRVQVRQVGRRTVEFAGWRWAVRDACRDLQLRTAMRAPHGPHWHVSIAEADDLMARLEQLGYRIEMQLGAVPQ